MENKNHLVTDKPKKPASVGYLGKFSTALYMILMAVFIASCAKDVQTDQSTVEPQIASSIAQTFPADLADAVVINPVVAVTFSSVAKVSAATITLKQGEISVPGKVTVSGTTATFTPSADLKANTVYTATVKKTLKSGSLSDSDSHSWSFKTGSDRDHGSLSVVSVLPLKGATAVPVAIQPTATFSANLTSSAIASTKFVLKQGLNTVLGSVSYSGKIGTFKPAAALLPNTLYTATITFGGSNDGKEDDDKSASIYSWSFTTAGNGGVDVTAPTVSSVVPANNATAVAITSKPVVNFSEAMNASTITSATFTLKQGTIAVAGTVTYSGTAATFTPAASLVAGAVYTGTITTGAKDVAGNALAANYTWSFTTAASVPVDVTAPTVTAVVPANSATAVAVTGKPTVTFSEAMTASTINATTITLKQGTTAVAGTVTYSGNTATFTPAAALAGSTVYTGTVTTGAKDAAGNALAANYTWSFTTAAVVIADVTPPTVLSAVPANGAMSVAVSAKPAITFSEVMTASTINATTITLKKGTTAVAGTVTYSGNTATFTPAAALAGSTVYTGTVTTGAKDAAGNAIAANYTWSFTTAAVVVADVTPPTVLSAVPANGATSVAVNAKPAITFSEAMTASTINATTITLKQGSTAVAGTVTYSGNTATFTPAAALAGSTVYTGTVTTGAKDAAGNAIAAAYTWSFTTAVVVVADVTPPTVLTIVPASGATSIATTSKVTATFSEAMTASTISASTFTVKQGTTAVAGTVSFSGNTATFTPSSALAGGMVYTATITTGAKDAAGNALAAAKVWSFTTLAPVAVTSWSTQVWPIIQSKCTVCHGASGGSAGINMGNYAQVSALSNSQIDNPGMYSKLGVTAAEQAIIKAWIAAGKPNN